MSKNKILIISANETLGGASIAANRLKSVLAEYNSLDIHMFVANKQTDNSKVITISNLKRTLIKVYRRIDKLIIQLFTDSTILNSTGLFGVVPSSFLNNAPFNVLNIHWINGSFLSIFSIGNLKKPVVFTLHDSWLFCGSEHHPIDGFSFMATEGYKEDFFNRMIWKLKFKLFTNKENFYFVSPSQWLASNFRKSFFNAPIEVIPNPIDCNTFRPLNNLNLREELGLSIDSDVKYILVGSFDGFERNPNKGIDLLLESFEYFTNPSFVCLTIGRNKDHIESKVPIKSLGFVSDASLLAKIYNAVDLVVIPSRIENLTQMGTESLSCGTPVIAFDVGGNKEIVEEGETGFLVKPFDTFSLYQKIDSYLKLSDKKIEKIRKKCRSKAVDKWCNEVVKVQYHELFEKIAKK